MEYFVGLLNQYQFNLFVQMAIFSVIIFLLCFIIFKIALPFFYHLIAKTKHEWDDLLVKNNFISRFCLIIPVILTDKLIRIQFSLSDSAEVIFSNSISITIIVVTASVVLSMINTVRDIFNKIESLKTVPIDNIRQLIMLCVYLFSGIFIISIIFGKSPLALLTGISAAMALLLLIFKDVILGFVAGVQLSLNRLVRVGDWIQFKKGDADGDVISVGLTVVKVRNFDKTITSIPVYDLVSNSFTNWRGMQETGARRIKRAIYIDQSSVGHLTPDNFAKLENHPLLQDYFKRKCAEGVAVTQITELPNKRALSNLGTFRAYVEAYLKNKTEIRNDLLIMCRQLAPSSSGLPLEIYCFTDTNWTKYEAIQADVFDHLLCVAPYFGLKIYQLDLTSKGA